LPARTKRCEGPCGSPELRGYYSCLQPYDDQFHSRFPRNRIKTGRGESLPSRGPTRHMTRTVIPLQGLLSTRRPLSGNGLPLATALHSKRSLTKQASSSVAVLTGCLYQSFGDLQSVLDQMCESTGGGGLTLLRIRQSSSPCRSGARPQGGYIRQVK